MVASDIYVPHGFEFGLDVPILKDLEESHEAITHLQFMNGLYQALSQD